MMIKRIVVFVLSFVMLIGMAGCAASLKPGKYEGSNPNVSFDVTAAGMENFTISVPFSGGTCTFSPLDTLKITLDGSFSYQKQVNSVLINSVSGKVNGNGVSGDYSLKYCTDGGLSVVTSPSQGKWNASYAGSIPTAEPTAVTPKPGHFEGTNPRVSFDVVENSSERYMQVVNLSLEPVGNTSSDCVITLNNLELMDDGNGHFAFVAYANSFANIRFNGQFYGRINGEDASGYYTANCGLTGNWTAKWVKP